MKVGYEHPSLRSLSSHDYSLLTTLGGALFLEVLQYQVDVWNARGKPLFHLTAVLSGRGRRDLRCCGGLDPPLPGVEAPFLLYHPRASVATKTTAWVLVSTRFPTSRLQEDLQTPYSMSIRGHSLTQP